MMARLAPHWRAACVLIWLALASSVKGDLDVFPTDFARADVNVGERLFLETRFSQYFYASSGGYANAVIPGDPTVATLRTTLGTVPGPFAGQAMSCRQCHLVDEEGDGPFGNQTLGNRTYCDFARRSPIPLRDDGRTQTPRNAMAMVDALIPRDVPLFLHHDGQFATMHDLIIGTLTGRNYGWKPGEYATAAHHIANIIRNDDGMGYLATEARGSRWQIEDTDLATYYSVFSGFQVGGYYITDPRSLTHYLISPQYRLDMSSASDEAILESVASLIEAYLRNLFFSQATNGLDFNGNGTAIFNGSPYDAFLIKNNLPQSPAPGESPAQYSRRLRQQVNRLSSPQFVTDPDNGHFLNHTQLFKFGPEELKGLRIFLADRATPPSSRLGGVGNCAACHPPPAFTDFIFHNTGASQEEYDSIHGKGAFNRLFVPGLAERQANYEAYLPPTQTHPRASGRFETPPTRDLPNAADLGLWNVFANPDFPAPQAGLLQILPGMVGLPAPQIERAVMKGDHFDLSGSDGKPNHPFYVLASTNPLSPNASWVTIATNVFDQRGHFRVSAPIQGNVPQTFYRLALRLPASAEALPLMLARFKTPTVRDLGHSDPYLHNGRMDSIADVLRFYQQFSDKARREEVRNADPELRHIFLEDAALAPLTAFLRALNEDYTD